MKAKSKDVLAAMNLPAEDAIKYLESKGYKITFSWTELSQKSHQLAFTVAGVVKMDMLKTIHEYTTNAIKNGTTIEDYKAGINNRLAEAGFASKFIARDKETGKTKVVELTPSRLENIFRTNLQSAYNAGRLGSQKKAIESSNEEMFYLYNATLDKRTRPSHRKLDGLVLPVSDPIWKSIYPPNGFRCRCSVSLLRAKQVQQMGLKISAKGSAKKAEPDEGFSGQPDGVLNPDLSGYPKEILAAYKREQQKRNQ